MIISEILGTVKSATHPVAKALFKGNGYKTLAIAFKSGMVLKDHKTTHLAKLLVIEGKINFVIGTKEIELTKFEEFDIPTDIVHSVVAIDDSIILLMQNQNADL
jgi:quercetin dioxygenase-like cupin family protein